MEMKRGFLVVNDFEYDDVKMPFRATKGSAGYDIINNGKPIRISPGALSEAIPTKIKSYMQSDEVLKIYPRSGYGFKYSVRLANTVGIIDSDYFNNEKNEGHIFIKLHNQGTEVLHIPTGEAMCQAIFEKYLVTDDDANTVGGKREGGLGSTSR